MSAFGKLREEGRGRVRGKREGGRWFFSFFVGFFSLAES
jgi:hypothetical protein